MVKIIFRYSDEFEYYLVKICNLKIIFNLSESNLLEMVITDLDGTLADTRGRISEADLNTLQKLSDRKVFRIIATGRSLYSAEKILHRNLPIDYLIFSSGAGILEWHNYKIINNNSFNRDEINFIFNYLSKLKVDFMLHFPIPDNHHFLYYDTGDGNPDFKRRLQIYKPFAMPLNDKPELDSATQFVLILPGRQGIFETVARDLDNFSVIRTTSPLDKQTLWIEIFPKQVSKSQAAEWLCSWLKIDRMNVLSIGNDYNDFDLLEWSGYSYVVGDAPVQLKQRFKVIESKHESALMHAVHQLIKL